MTERTASRGLPAWSYVLIWLAMLAIRQDFWLASDRTLLYGVMPVGLAYQAGYSLLATLVLAWLVRVAWPSHLEVDEEPARGGEPR